jgi:hypothetical protein
LANRKYNRLSTASGPIVVDPEGRRFGQDRPTRVVQRSRAREVMSERLLDDESAAGESARRVRVVPTVPNREGGMAR